MISEESSVLIPDECDQPLAYYLVRCLKAANRKLKIYILTPSDKLSSKNSWLTFYKSSRYVDQVIVSKNRMDSVDYLYEISDFIKNNNIEVVLPASELGFNFVSKTREDLSALCHLAALPSHDALNIAFNKWTLSVFLKKHTISTPKTILLEEFQLINQLSYPVLLKPVYGSGGENIQKYNSPEEIKSAVNLNNDSRSYIVQEYIDGYDIDCNVVCTDGQILTYTIQQPLGVEKGFSPKIDKLKFVHDPSVIDLVKKTMNHLNWSGVAHLDLRYCSQTGKLYLIEINPRFWQSLLGSLSVGVNFPHLLYLLSIGIDIELVDYQDQYYAKFIRYIKDALAGSLDYGLDQTNFKVFMSDLVSLIEYQRNRLFNHS